MRALGGRPILMERYPEGAGGPSFFQKRAAKNAAPAACETTTVETPNGTPSRPSSRPTSSTSCGR